MATNLTQRSQPEFRSTAGTFDTYQDAALACATLLLEPVITMVSRYDVTVETTAGPDEHVVVELHTSLHDDDASSIWCWTTGQPLSPGSCDHLGLPGGQDQRTAYELHRVARRHAAA